MCNDWSHVMIFPEATTTNGKVLVSFKAGAFTPGFSVQPVVIRYPHVHLDPSWTAEGPAILSLLLRLMTQFHNFMEVSLCSSWLHGREAFQIRTFKADVKIGIMLQG